MQSRLKGALAGLAIALGSACAATAQSGSVLFNQTIETEHLSWEPQYSVYLPPGYAEGSRHYPVIYLMPGGAGQTHNDWFISGAAAETLDRMIGAGEIPPVIAISPDPRRLNRPEFNTYYLDDSDGSERWETMFIEDFVPQVETRYRTLGDGKFRSAIGLSMGGYGALIYSYRHEGLFASVAALSPAIRTDEQILEMNQTGWDRRYGQTWGVGHEGEARLHDRYFKDSVFRQIEEFTAANREFSTQLLIDTGADDVFFEGSVLLHRLLRSQGNDERTLLSSHRFMVREGGHDWAYWRSGLPEALRFVTSVMEDQ